MIELIIVVVIISILGSIGLSYYSDVQNQAHDAAVQQDLNQFKVARDIYVAQGGTVRVVSIADFPFEAAQGSYETDSTDHNLVYCAVGEGSIGVSVEEWHLVGLSKSGNAFSIGHDQGNQKPRRVVGRRKCRDADL